MAVSAWMRTAAATLALLASWVVPSRADIPVVELDGVVHGVSATHVKVTQHSWHEVQSLTPLLPVSPVAGRGKVEVVGAE